MPKLCWRTTNFVWSTSIKPYSGSTLKVKGPDASIKRVSNMEVSLLNTLVNSMNHGDGTKERISSNKFWKRENLRTSSLNFITSILNIIMMILMVMTWWLLIQLKRVIFQVASHIPVIQIVERLQRSLMANIILECMHFETSNMENN